MTRWLVSHHLFFAHNAQASSAYRSFRKNLDNLDKLDTAFETNALSHAYVSKIFARTKSRM